MAQFVGRPVPLYGRQQVLAWTMYEVSNRELRTMNNQEKYRHDAHSH